MQDTVSSKAGARVITIRIRGRLTPLFGILLLVALLPFLAASGPQRASVMLAVGAGHPAAPNERQPDGQALGGGALAPAPGMGDAINPLAAGANIFLFPSMQLAPSATAEVLAASVKGLPAFIWPVRGPESSGFGPRVHPVLGRAMFHTGVDLVAACGTPIRAAADGRVVYAAITPSWGRRVIIQHTPGLETGYAHMSQFLVSSGEAVKQGQVIGLVGTTGWSTGCHLHFDVIVDGQYVDPAPYLGLPPSTTARIPYYAAPHLVLDDNGTVVHTVEDGDVPIPPDADSRTPSKSTSLNAPRPTTSSPAPTTTETTTEPTHRPTTPVPTGTPSPTESTTTAPTEPPTGTPTTNEPTSIAPTGTPPPTASTTTAPTGTPTPTESTTTTTPTGTPTTATPTGRPTTTTPTDTPTTTTPTGSPTPTKPTACPSGSTTTSTSTTSGTATTSAPTDTSAGTCSTPLSTEPDQPGVAGTGSQPSTG
jgi:hypothetical protein